MRPVLIKKMLKHPTDIMLFACALMSFWAGLYGTDMQGKILEGVKILISCVHKVMAQQMRPPSRLLLDGPTRRKLDPAVAFWVARCLVAISCVSFVLCSIAAWKTRF